MRAVSQKNPCSFINAFSTVLLLLFLSIGCTHLGLNNSSATPSHSDVKRSYFPNGNLEYEAEFINEKLDGTSRVWSTDGTLLSVSEYINGQPHGVWKTFHSNEKLKYETTYFHSQKHGYERWYYENGQLKSEQKFSYGKPETEIVRWNVDGTILY
jgi:antitoxin component YwqK of YwqJK toxin-antitoxin module